MPNPYHDPSNGRFTSKSGAGGGGKAMRKAVLTRTRAKTSQRNARSTAQSSDASMRSEKRRIGDKAWPHYAASKAEDETMLRKGRRLRTQMDNIGTSKVFENQGKSMPGRKSDSGGAVGAARRQVAARNRSRSQGTAVTNTTYRSNGVRGVTRPSDSLTTSSGYPLAGGRVRGGGGGKGLRNDRNNIQGTTTSRDTTRGAIRDRAKNTPAPSNLSTRAIRNKQQVAAGIRANLGAISEPEFRNIAGSGRKKNTRLSPPVPRGTKGGVNATAASIRKTNRDRIKADNIKILSSRKK